MSNVTGSTHHRVIHCHMTSFANTVTLGEAPFPVQVNFIDILFSPVKGTRLTLMSWTITSPRIFYSIEDIEGAQCITIKSLHILIVYGYAQLSQQGRISNKHSCRCINEFSKRRKLAAKRLIFDLLLAYVSFRILRT
jgi:hypothetical protein